MRFRVALLPAVVLVVGLTAPRADAALITYSFAGTLGGTDFTDAPVAFTLTAGTAGVFAPVPNLPNILTTRDAVLRFTIDGVSGTFAEPFHVLSNTFGPFGTVGLSPVSGNDLVDVRDRALAGYDLRTSFGPLTQAPPDFLNPGEAYATTAGDLILEDTGSESLTFRAVLAPAAVPGPASVWLMAAGGLGLLGYARRRATAR